LQGEENLATTPNNWTPSQNLVQQPLMQTSNDPIQSSVTTCTGFPGCVPRLEEHLVTAQINVILPTNQGESHSVQFILPEDGAGYNVAQSPELAATAPQPGDQRLVETPVQKHRRIKKENKSVLLVEELCLDVELTEKMKKMTELNAEIRILSRLSRAGSDITQTVQGWVNQAADAER